MTAPSVFQAASTTSAGVSDTSHPVTIPAHAAGDAILVDAIFDGNPDVTVDNGASSAGWNVGWNRKNTTGSTTPTSVGLSLIATSNDHTLTLSTGATGEASEIRVRVVRKAGSGSLNVFAATPTNGSGSNGTPPAINPGAGTQDMLFLLSYGQDGVQHASGAPSGYSNFVATSNAVSSRVDLATCEKAATGVSSDTPGAFTAAPEQWVAGGWVVWETAGSSGPTIDTQPTDQNVIAPAAATFSIASADAVSFQWQVFNGSTWVNVSEGTGGTTNSYTTAATELADDGTQYRCQVTNGDGTTTSATVTLNVSDGKLIPGNISTGGPLTAETSVSVPAASGMLDGHRDLILVGVGALAPAAAPVITQLNGVAVGSLTDWTYHGQSDALVLSDDGLTFNLRLAAFSRVADGAGSAVTVAADSAGYWGFDRIWFANAHADFLAQISFDDLVTTTAPVLPGITPTKTNAYLLQWHVLGKQVGITPPGGTTELAENTTNALGLYGEQLDDLTPTGTRTYAYASPGASAGFAVLELHSLVSESGAGTITGSLNKTLDPLSLSAAGVAPIAAAAAITLGGPSLASTAAVRVAGQVSALLGEINAAAAATVRVAGSAAITLDGLGLSATGVVGSTPVIGSAAITLGGLGVSAAGQVQVSGAAANTLGPLGLASAGAVRVNGSAAVTLGALSLSAAGTVGPGTITGSLSATLAPLTAVATAVARVTGSLSSSLDALSLSAAGAVRVTGQAAITLDGLQVAATGGGVTLASASITLGALTLSATGVVLTLSQEPSLLVAYVPAPQNLARVPAGIFTAFAPADPFGTAVPEGDHTATV